MKVTQHHIYAAIITFAIVLTYLVVTKVPPLVNSFDECAQYYPVMESFPSQCNTPDGKHFVQEVYESSEITVTGQVVCLPHKNTKGPITLECAIGLKSDNTHYSLSDPRAIYLDLPMGKTVTVVGEFTNETSAVYDIVGKIEITSITQ